MLNDEVAVVMEEAEIFGREDANARRVNVCVRDVKNDVGWFAIRPLFAARRNACRVVAMAAADVLYQTRGPPRRKSYSSRSKMVRFHWPMLAADNKWSEKPNDHAERVHPHFVTFGTWLALGSARKFSLGLLLF